MKKVIKTLCFLLGVCIIICGLQHVFIVSDYRVFHTVKGFYEELGKLRLVEGNQPIEDATRDIMAALGV